jgi:hypothetical protein
MLEVLERVEPPQRQKRRLQIADHPLVLAFAIRVAWPQHDRLETQRTERRGDVIHELRRTATAGLDHRGVVVEHHRLGHTAEALETPDERRRSQPSSSRT